MNTRLLHIYLRDHHAAAIGGLELARRALGNNRENEFGRLLERISVEIEEDKATLEGVMQQLGVSVSRVKVGLMWAGEKVGRLKLNGRVTGYSELSRVYELEGLAMAVEGKKGLWLSLKQAAQAGAIAVTVDLDALIERADRQRRELQEHHDRAAAIAFTRETRPT